MRRLLRPLWPNQAQWQWTVLNAVRLASLLIKIVNRPLQSTRYALKCLGALLAVVVLVMVFPLLPSLMIYVPWASFWNSVRTTPHFSSQTISNLHALQSRFD